MNARRMAWGLVAVALVALVGVGFSPGARADFIPANGDYATGANWDGGSVPSGAANAHILMNTGDSRAATYASATSYTTTGRFIAGLGAGTGRLTMNPGAATLTFGGDDVNNANYVGVDGGTGYLDVQAGTFTTTTGALRVGSNGATARGTVWVGAGATINVGTAPYTPNLYVGAGSAANVGTVYLDGGTLNVRGRVDLGQTGGTGTMNVNGGTFNVNGQVYMNNGGGTGVLNVRGDSTVNLASDLVLQGANAGTGFQAPSGSGTIGVSIYNGLFNPINVAGNLYLNPGVSPNPFTGFTAQQGGSHLAATLTGTLPAVGTSWTILNHTGTLNGAQFDVGTDFTNSQGYRFELDYGKVTNGKMTLGLVAGPGQALFFDVGPAVSPSGNTLNQTLRSGLAWNNLGFLTGGQPYSGVQHADGSAASGVTVTISGVGGRDGNGTLNAGWGDAQSVPQGVMDSWYWASNGTMTFTLTGFDPTCLYDVDIFNAFNTGTTVSDMMVNGRFADGSVATLPLYGDNWDRRTTGWDRRIGLLFDDIMPDALGRFIITCSGGNPTLEAIRITYISPEPGTLSLLGLGGLALLRRRRRSA